MFHQHKFYSETRAKSSSRRSTDRWDSIATLCHNFSWLSYRCWPNFRYGSDFGFNFISKMWSSLSNVTISNYFLTSHNAENIIV